MDLLACPMDKRGEDHKFWHKLLLECVIAPYHSKLCAKLVVAHLPEIGFQSLRGLV
jgi:hypothetical protein